MRLHYRNVDKAGFGKILELLEYIKQGGIEEGLIHMLYLRVSQINGCSYCIDLHWKDAMQVGVEARRLNGLAAWRHMPFFNARERAALQWAESLTRLDKQQVPQEDFDGLRAQFSEAECMTLTLAVTQMNALNRLVIAFARHPEV